MNVIGNPIEMDDQEFIFTIEYLKKKLINLQCPVCKEESTLFFSMKDPSFKRLQICCQDFTPTVYDEISRIVENLPYGK